METLIENSYLQWKFKYEILKVYREENDTCFLVHLDSLYLAQFLAQKTDSIAKTDIHTQTLMT